LNQPVQESDADKIARLESENAALAAATPEPGSAAADEPAIPQPAPLAALAASVNANPSLGFVGHLEVLANDGIKAVISPAVEKDVLATCVAILADITKVKL
jgi:hypothetical protein